MPHEPFDSNFDEGFDDGPQQHFDFRAGAQGPPFSFSSDGPPESERSCPQCQSGQIEPRHLARRVAAVLGVTAGATDGVVRALQAAELVSVGVGVAAGGPIARIVASTVAAALLDGAAGCALGVKFGDAIDRAILPSYRCLSCKHTFSAPVDSAA